MRSGLGASAIVIWVTTPRHALGESPVDIRADTPLIGSIDGGAAHLAQCRAIKATVGQDRFQRHNSAEMVGVGGDAVTAL